NVRKITNLEADLQEAAEKDKYQKYGELITAYMHSIKNYQESAVVMDYYTNEEIEIPLDKQLSPAENAQRYYNMYNKLKNREKVRSEEHTSELQSRFDIVGRLLLEKKKGK